MGILQLLDSVQWFSIIVLSLIDLICLIILLIEILLEANRRHKKTMIVFAYSVVTITIMIVGILLGGNPPDWICGFSALSMIFAVPLFLFYLIGHDYGKRSEAIWRKRIKRAVDKSLNDPEKINQKPNFKK